MKTYCRYSLEAPLWSTSNEYLQHHVSVKKCVKYQVFFAEQKAYSGHMTWMLTGKKDFAYDILSLISNSTSPVQLANLHSLISVIIVLFVRDPTFIFKVPETIKPIKNIFSCSTQLGMKISLLINMKMPTKVGIFIFISREIFMLSYV